MDFSQLQNLLENIQSKPQKIRNLVEYILINTSSNQAQIAKCMQKQFYNLSTDRQLAIFYSISQILIIGSQKRELGYFKVFGSKIKQFLQTLSKQISDVRIMKDICRTIQKWQQQQMFSSNFIQKLKSTIKNFYIKVVSYNEEQQKLMGYKKYKKTFLMQIVDLKYYPICDQLYQLYCQYNQIQLKLVNINNEYVKLDLNKSQTNTNQYIVKRSQQLLKIYNDLSGKLQNIVDKIQQKFNKVRKWANQQYQVFKKQYQIA